MIHPSLLRTMRVRLLSLTFCCLILGGQASFLLADPPPNLPDGFVDANAVIPSIVLDIRYYTAHNFVGKPIDGYFSPRCILTIEAADALRKVQQDLKRFSLSLKVYDCYRPQRAVDRFVRWAKDLSDIKMKKEFYPTVSKKHLFRDGYIARKSGHSRGSTVDLTIVPLPVPGQEPYGARTLYGWPDMDGQELCECHLPAEMRFKDSGMDMGTGYDCFHEHSRTAIHQIDAQPRANRLLLRTLMEKHGFENYRKEWWHFTLKSEPFPMTYFDFRIE